jgi:aspartyl/asparaginyl beta-hydroxylase (cupin superfamily)
MKQLYQVFNELKSKHRKFVITQGENVVRRLEFLYAQYSIFGDKTFFNPQQFSWTEELEANWEIIREELTQILNKLDTVPNFQDISPDQYDVTNDNRWKTYFLYAYGIKAQKNSERCPETTRLIEEIPGMKTAFFSILLPHKHIPEHKGPHKGLLRYLLALKVPKVKENCRIRVGNEVRHWEEGKSLMFDDTFPHEVWNDTDEIRVVLFLDIVRPLRFPMSLFNQFFIWLISISPYVQTGKKKLDEWEKNLVS